MQGGGGAPLYGDAGAGAAQPQQPRHAGPAAAEHTYADPTYAVGALPRGAAAPAGTVVYAATPAADAAPTYDLGAPNFGNPVGGRRGTIDGALCVAPCMRAV